MFQKKEESHSIVNGVTSRIISTPSKSSCNLACFPNNNVDSSIADGLFPCPNCRKVFKRGDHLKRHLLAVHDQYNPYHCGECHKGFVTVDSLVQHNAVAHINISVKKPCVCNWCDIKFGNVLDLGKHASVFHKAQDMMYMNEINGICKVVSCCICNKTVSSAKILERHIKKTHREHKDHIDSSYIVVAESTPDVRSDLNIDEGSPLTDCISTDPHKNLMRSSPTEVVHTSSIEKSQQNKPSQLNYRMSDTSTLKRNKQCTSSSNAGLPQHFQLETCSSPNIRIPDQQSHFDKHTSSSTLQHQVVARNIQKSSAVKSNALPKLQLPYCTHNSKLNLTVSRRENEAGNKYETNTVSEAFSMAMRTLSDFSYDGLFLHAAEYLPTKLSVFQSSSPLPNFHYPNTVQLSDPWCLISPTAFTDASSKQIVSSEESMPPCGKSLSCPTRDNGQIHFKTHSETRRGVTRESGSSLAECSADPNCSPIQARRGRPKKRRRGDNDDDEEEYGAQTMILKEDDASTSVAFNCTVCNEMFKGIDNLMQHIEKVHLNQNPHECCICKKRFAQAGNVKRHIRFVHLRERPFQCRSCNSTFDRLCYLQRHMRSHIDSKVQTLDASWLNPCNCPECGKRCLTAHHLRGHMQRKHFAKNKKLSDDFVKKYGHLFDGVDECMTTSPLQKPDEFESVMNPKKGKVQQVYFPFDCNTAEKREKSVKESADTFLCNSYRKQNEQLSLTEKNNSNLLRRHQNEAPTNSAILNEVNKPGNTPQLQALLQSEQLGNGHPERKKNVLDFPHARTDEVAKQNSLIRVVLPNQRLRERGPRIVYLYKNCKNFSNRYYAGLRYKCRHCINRRFSSLNFLKSHVAVAHHSTTHRHLCLICGRSYSAKGLLIAHIREKHNVQKR